MRSLLSLLGLTVAIAGMVGLFSVAEGLDYTVNRTFEQIPGLTVMQPGAPVPLFSKLPASWEKEIQEIDGVGVVNAQVVQRISQINGKAMISPPRLLFGTEISTRLELKKDVYGSHLVAGRFFTRNDRGTNHVIVSQQIADQLQITIGDTFDIENQEVELIGIYNTKLSLLDVAVMIDIDSARRMTRYDVTSVSCFYLEKSDETIADEELSQRITARFQNRPLEKWNPSQSASELSGFESHSFTTNVVTMLFRWLSSFTARQVAAPTNIEAKSQSPQKTKRSNLLGEKSSPIEVRTTDDWGARIDEFSQDLNLFLTVLTGIGMTIAVLSIVNTMLMSVSERIVEFGVLKANGWSAGDVMKLIAFESALLGFSGGICGIALGWIATQVINAQWPDRLQLFASPELLLFSVVFSTSMGILGGLYPAIWAMRMPPMVAIRRS